MSGRGNVRSGKHLSEEKLGRGSLCRGSVQSRNCPFGEMSIGEMSVGEVSVGDLSLEKCQSGKFPVEEMSLYSFKLVEDIIQSCCFLIIYISRSNNT